MVFSDTIFLFFFLPAVILCVKLCPRRFRNAVLLLFSLLFYAWGEPIRVFLLLGVIVFNYLAGRSLELCPAATEGKKRRIVLIVAVAVDLAVLFCFKYAGTFAGLAGAASSRALVLPIGVSFYILQCLSYVIDVYRGSAAPQRNVLTLGAYVSLFPKLIAGPIVRYVDIKRELTSREETAALFSRGAERFIYGLGKKVLLADQLGILADRLLLQGTGTGSAWMGILAYALQIYFDFSGYSDMAIGCAKCLGYDFHKNFDLPYISQNVTEFWRRWHISLSGWLKEYLYIPLGGNRRGEHRRYVNLFLTMLLGGLWHGADWTFVFWGGLNGLALCLDKAAGKKGIALPGRLLRVFGTFAFITFTWIFFRADSFAAAWTVIRGVISLQDGIRQPFFWSFVGLAFLLIGTVAADRKAAKKGEKVSGFYPVLDLNSIWGLTLFFTEIGLILALAYTGENPFVYFQF
jgi:alginate O-acetyltransferase complex protein AlgI